MEDILQYCAMSMPIAKLLCSRVQVETELSRKILKKLNINLQFLLQKFLVY